MNYFNQKISKGKSIRSGIVVKEIENGFEGVIRMTLSF